MGRIDSDDGWEHWSGNFFSSVDRNEGATVARIFIFHHARENTGEICLSQGEGWGWGQGWGDERRSLATKFQQSLETIRSAIFLSFTKGVKCLTYEPKAKIPAVLHVSMSPFSSQSGTLSVQTKPVVLPCSDQLMTEMAVESCAGELL